MIMKVGPFTFYRLEEDGTLDISLTCMDEWPCGWEYGWEDPAADRHPWIDLRIGKLRIFEFEKFKNGGGELWFFGFWVIWGGE